MAVDFVTDADRRFFADNLLFSEDWDTCPEKLDDISDLLTVQHTLSADDLIADLPDDFEMGQLDHHCNGSEEVDMWRDLSDSSDSGLGDSTPEFTAIKSEPLSPLYSSEASSSPILTLSNITEDLMSPLPNEYIKPESPVSRPAYTLVNQTSMSMVTSPTTQTLITLPSNSVQNLSAFPNLNGMKIAIPANKNATNFTLKSRPPMNTSHSAILNAKVKIQPSSPVQSVAANIVTKPISPVQGKKLVLTAEEFAKLTAQGMLKVAVPQIRSPVKSPPPSVAVVPEAAPTVIQHSLPYADVDMSGSFQMKSFKRQQRMIKNRESACLSRRKKKKVPTATLR